jgi:hypothetical protein
MLEKYFQKGFPLLYSTDFRGLKHSDDFFVGIFSRIYSIRKSNSGTGLKWEKTSLISVITTL